MKHGNRRRSAPARDSSAGTVIYGWHSALAALLNPRRKVHRLLATRNAMARLAEHGARDLPEPVEAREIERLVGVGAVHQGIALLADPLPEYDIADIGNGSLVVVLDQVTDPHNVGAIIRSAAAFGGVPVVMTERHGPADTAVLAKAASGGLEYVALVRVKNLARALDQLGEAGYFRVGLESDTPDLLEDVLQEDKIAIVLGAEGKGLRRLTREKCDRLVRLRTSGPIASLNVSNAAAVALYALTRRPG